MKQLRDRNAVGVVVAVNGELIWADVFASTELLQKYWPKLVRSYAEAMVTPGEARSPEEKRRKRSSIICEAGMKFRKPSRGFIVTRKSVGTDSKPSS